MMNRTSSYYADSYYLNKDALEERSKMFGMECEATDMNGALVEEKEGNGLSKSDDLPELQYSMRARFGLNDAEDNKPKNYKEDED